jgi:hypothetical protein
MPAEATSARVIIVEPGRDRKNQSLAMMSRN